MIVDLADAATPLTELPLELPEHVYEEKRGEDQQAELRFMLGKRNSVGLSDPVVRRSDEPLDNEMRQRVGLPVDDLEILSVFATLDCRPDPDCRFNWVRVEVTLGDHAPRPVACRLYPARAEDQVKRVRAVNIGANASINVLGVDGPGVTVGQTTTTEAEMLQYRVMTFGRYGSTPAWHFAATDVAPEVVGDIFLALVVAAPRGANTTATIVVSAEAQLKTIPFAVPLITRRTGDGLNRNVFPLRAPG